MTIEVKRLSEAELSRLGVRSWPVWKKEVSTFPWHYDETEQCLFLEGAVEIELPDGGRVRIQAGDYAVFPQGLSCTWHVLEPVRKHYRFV